MGLVFINTYAVRGRTKVLHRVLGYLRGRAGAQRRKNIGVEVCRTAETSKARSHNEYKFQVSYDQNSQSPQHPTATFYAIKLEALSNNYR